jgi:hypothetical protein
LAKSQAGLKFRADAPLFGWAGLADEEEPLWDFLTTPFPAEM